MSSSIMVVAVVLQERAPLLDKPDTETAAAPRPLARSSITSSLHLQATSPAVCLSANLAGSTCV